MVIQRSHHTASQHRFRFSLLRDAGADQLLHLLHHHRHGPVMRLNKTPIFPDQRHDGHTFGGGERQVIATAVFVDTIHHPGQVTAIRQSALADRIHIGAGHLPLQAQLLRAFPHPAGIQ